MALRTTLWQDRSEAGRLLAGHLKEYARKNAVVVGIPRGGAWVAAAISESLVLPLKIVPCRKIKSPSDRNKFIGSVCEGETFLHHEGHDIPQDYLFHQLVMIKRAIEYENQLYASCQCTDSISGKTVILADDILVTGDSILATLRTIRKENPAKIIVAIPICRAEAIAAIRNEADEFIFLLQEPVLKPATDYYVDFTQADPEQIIGMLKHCNELCLQHS